MRNKTKREAVKSLVGWEIRQKEKMLKFSKMRNMIKREDIKISVGWEILQKEKMLRV